MSTLPPPQSDADLTQQATQQVGQEIASEVGPLQNQIGSLQGSETAAIGQIGSMFDQLQPVVSQGAQFVQSSYDQANKASQSIFEEAQRRMDALANQRAAQAQALAQQMGGPVAVGEFTAGVEPDRQALASIAPNQLMHGLVNAQAGEQYASAYAERVFPALRTEQVSKARGYFEDQIKDLRKQIDQINAGSGALINSRLTELRASERAYALQLEQQKLDRLKADRDWQATQHTLHNDDTRLALAKGQFGLQQAGVTGKYQGRPTMQATKLAADEKLAAQRLGLSNQQYLEMVRHHTVTEAQGNQRLANSTKANAMAILDAATGAKKGPQTMLVRTHLSRLQGLSLLKNPNLEIVGSGKHAQYYIRQKRTLTQAQMLRKYGSGFANNPQQLYDVLIGSNVPNAMALQLVRDRTGVGDFSPGKPVKYSAADLHAIGQQSFNELRGIAIARGWKPPKNHKATQQTIIDYILSRQAGMP